MEPGAPDATVGPRPCPRTGKHDRNNKVVVQALGCHAHEKSRLVAAALVVAALVVAAALVAAALVAAALVAAALVAAALVAAALVAVAAVAAAGIDEARESLPVDLAVFLALGVSVILVASRALLPWPRCSWPPAC